ncbi:MAG: diguanylate cyclase [Anaerolineae bacterium]
MADLSVPFLGMTFRNPVLPAAGPPGWNGEALRKCAVGGAGALVTKTISDVAAQVPHPNMAQVAGGFLNTELWSELPPEQWFEKELPLARELGLPLIVSMGYTARQIAALAPKVRPFADAIELSTHYLGDDPRPMMEAIDAAKSGAGKPVIVKLSPMRDMKAAAQAAQEAGADAIAAINSFGPTMGIDIETGQPWMGSAEGYGWLSGPALRPLAVRCIFDIARTVDLPILGVGGVSRGTDAIELIMAGAWAVQVCTAVILQGHTVLGKIAGEINQWLDNHGYVNLQSIRGLAVERVSQRAGVRTQAVPPELEPELCTGCRLCEQSCVYDAIQVVDGLAKLDVARCWGCGLCVTRCKPRALSMRYD